MSTRPEPDALGSGDGEVAADIADERLIRVDDVVGQLRAFGGKIRGGDLGMMPVILGLVLICFVFYLKEPSFLSSRSLVSLTQFAVPTGVIALGIVLVLLLGEIDLSVGCVAGFTSAITAVQVVNHGTSLPLAIAMALGAGVAIGAFYAVLYCYVGVPSFVFTMAGWLAFQGALLYTLGEAGTITLPRDSWLRDFARNRFLSETEVYVLAALAGLLYVGAGLLSIQRRRRAGLTPPSTQWLVVRGVALTGALAYFGYYLSIARGVPHLFVFFVLLVVVTDLCLRRTRWGRHVYAVGGNREAARRAGINVTGIYFSVFILCSLFAAVGGLLLAGQLTTVSQTSGTIDTNLTAIAAAVIGGTSLFGGRGSAYAALLGMLVLQAITAGLNVINVDSALRYVVTGGVLLLAVAIDSVARKARESSGRG